MGFNEDGSPSDWYGGQVQFRGSLAVDQASKELKLKLEKPIMGPSTQLARRFGSKPFSSTIGDGLFYGGIGPSLTGSMG